MSTKTIKIILGGSKIETISTDAKTWGEFKAELKDVELPSPHNAILGETRMVLLDESILPEPRLSEGNETPISIFVTPVKSKSGLGRKKKTEPKKGETKKEVVEEVVEDTPVVLTTLTPDWAEEASSTELREYAKAEADKDDKAEEFFGNFEKTKVKVLRAQVETWIEDLITAQESLEKERLAKIEAAKAEATKTEGVTVESKNVIDLNNPAVAIDSIIGFLEAVKEKMDAKGGESCDGKLVFTVEEVSEKDFSKMKKLVS